MGMRRNIFIRTMGLLGLLVASVVLCAVLFLVWQNRAQWADHCASEAGFMAERSERMVLWDDRVGLHDMLTKRLSKRESFQYAFVEKDGRPYVSTIERGVPANLLGMDEPTELHTVKREFTDETGHVFYDFAASVGKTGAVIHLGVLRNTIDGRVVMQIRLVSLAGLLLLALVAVPAWLSAGAITAEADWTTAELRTLNDELEARVNERTAKLMEANESLEAEIAERMRLEKQKADFYAMVTHDLKTPIAVIAGYVDLLKDKKEELGEDAADMVDAIGRGGARLSTLVGDFLMTTRIEMGRQSLELGPVDTAELAMAVKMELSCTAMEKGIALTIETEDRLPMAMWDERYVHRALANLVRNAVVYTQEGGHVNMKVHATTDAGGRQISLTVEDDGPGIPQKEQEKIFEKYYRSASATDNKGSGLGLFIVDGVARAHGGRVELTSAPGMGSTFSMVMPVEP